MNRNNSDRIRILLGPGPSMVAQRVLEAMTQPILGYLDPDLFAILLSIQGGLRSLFRTRNEVTLALPGTGMSGMECAFTNLLEPGDRALIAIHGFFGERMAEIARRCGAEVHMVSAEWGSPLQPDQIESMLKQFPKWKMIACVHAETSTGVLQPIEPIAELARRYEALLVVDAVTSLGGIPVEVDKWGVDVCYSATQKCVGAPPGLAPITVSPNAWKVIQNRRSLPQDWYLDLRLLMDYWGEKHIYHHTTPVSLMFALDEALQMIEEEGLEIRWDRHEQHAHALWAGLQELGLAFMVNEPHRLPTLTSVKVPSGVDDAEFRWLLLNEYNIEIGGGLGKWRGQVWRIGLMGKSCVQKNVDLLLAAMSRLLKHSKNG